MFEIEYNRIRRDWIKYKPTDWTLEKFVLLAYAADLFNDNELIHEDYDYIITENFIKL